MRRARAKGMRTPGKRMRTLAGRIGFPAGRNGPRFLIALALAACLSPAAFANVLLKPKADAGAAAWQGGTFPDTSFEGVRYVSSRFLENLFAREGAWVPDRQKFVLPDSSGRKWYFTLDNPYINVGDEVDNLIYPVRRGPEFLYLPLPPLLRLLALKGWAIESPEPAPAPVREKPEPRAAVMPGGANLLDVGAEDRENGTLVSVRVAGPMEWESYWVPPHFILKLQGGLVSSRYPLKAPGSGLVKSIFTVQEKDLAQVTLLIQKPIDTVEVAYSPETLAYQLTVRKPPARKASGDEADDRRGNGKGDSARAKARTATIIIDPGHGGKDQGAMVAGVNEAQVTLAVAKELKTALTRLGYRALMTRESDTFISLPDRPKFASEKGGDIFISLHCNSIGGAPKHKQEVSGFTAYILREGESEEDKALARRENEAIGAEGGKTKGEISPVEWILLEHQLNLYAKESESFAADLIAAFEGNGIPKYQTGASQAGFYVLVGAYMPAVLFEMGFLTNDKDRRVLASEKGRKQIAERLAKAIDRYRKTHASGAPTAREGGSKPKGKD
jgi:N-acetylmuramoyl-L-alanine amidase